MLAIVKCMYDQIIGGTTSKDLDTKFKCLRITKTSSRSQKQRYTIVIKYAVRKSFLNSISLLHFAREFVKEN
jgi:hypothetical protein